MRQWPAFWHRIVKEAFGEQQELLFARFFESKKNQVTRLSLSQSPYEVIAKYYVWGDSQREHEALTQAFAAGVRVPEPLAQVGSVTFLRPVEGQRLHSPVEENVARKVGRWLRQFHSLKVVEGREQGPGVFLRGDCVIPNFLQDEHGEIYGLDLEEAGWGDPWQDCAPMATSLLVSALVPEVMCSGSQAEVQSREAAAQGWSRVEAFMQGYEQEWQQKPAFGRLMWADLQAKKRYRPDLMPAFLCAEAFLEQQLGSSLRA